MRASQKSPDERARLALAITKARPACVNRQNAGGGEPPGARQAVRASSESTETKATSTRPRTVVV